MKRFLLLSLFSALHAMSVMGGVVKGKVVDANSGEPLPGATIFLKGEKLQTITGMDGSFIIKTRKKLHEVKLVCNYIGYKKAEKEIDIDEKSAAMLTLALKPSSEEIRELEVVGRANRATDTNARLYEKNSVSLVNCVSARAIELSPDITVANVVQRVSGVSVERSNSGDGQYAILRGMDKRYNYTLVNGIKIPSPDNKNRYIPLDIFPAEMLDRLDVSKALTPSMEGDAVGGVVNMLMKDAPNRFMLAANAAVGYSQRYFDRSFLGFDYGAIDYKTPFEKHGYNSDYKAKMDEFTTRNLSLSHRRFVPNFNMGLTVGNRFFDQKLGIMVSGSVQSNYRGNNGVKLSTAAPRTAPIGMISNMKERTFSEHQLRTGILAKADYRFNKNHTLAFSNVFVNLQNSQVRNEHVAGFSKGYDPDNLVGTETYRLRFKNQTILNSSLQGWHKLTKLLNIDWTGSYSKAKGETPDNAMISMSRNTIDGVLQPQEITFGNSPSISRRWEHSDDRDFSGYVNISYLQKMKHHQSIEWSTGGMYRDKKRSNFNNEYYFTNQAGTPNVLVYGRDFNDFTDIPLDVYNPQGSASNALTYDAYERIGAAYLQFVYNSHRLQVTGGVRMEHTDQGYALKYQSPIESLRVPDGNSVYADWLPSLHFKYHLTKKQQLRLSYFRSINRPGYFEMVPYTIVNEDYTEKGNPDLKRAIIDNADLRYEYFPSPTEQFMCGIFYKRIKDPIEYALQRPAGESSQDLFYMPGNFGTAHNFGIELDAIKYFRCFGVKANYTYTKSSIKTEKTGWVDGKQITAQQKRPLFGQSAHVANVSLLYKGLHNGLNMQIALSYTGDRISSVSQFLDNDIWQKGFLQGDFSAEKQFRHISVFVKVNNLFNTRMEEYIKLYDSINDGMPYQDKSSGRTLISRERYGQTYLAGVRYKF